MKTLITGTCIATALTLPAVADARPVTVTAQLQAYGGNGAYLAIYVTDAAGKVQKTLAVAGKKAKYYKHLSGWAAGSGAKFDGVSGASVGSGKALKVTVDLADALIDAGFEIRVDSAVEDGRAYPADVRAPLTKAGAGKPVKGRGYVQSLSYQL